MRSRFEFKVVGMTFLHELPYGATYPDSFMQISKAMDEEKAATLGWVDRQEDTQAEFNRPKVSVLLFRNPENPYDANAIEVHVPLLGRRSMIGHVPRDIAAQLAPSMDNGDKWNATLDFILIEPGHESNPGAQISVVLAE